MNIFPNSSSFPSLSFFLSFLGWLPREETVLLFLYQPIFGLFMMFYSDHQFGKQISFISRNKLIISRNGSMDLHGHWNNTLMLSSVCLLRNQVYVIFLEILTTNGTEYNTQTSDLCKRTLPQNLDGSLIGWKKGRGVSGENNWCNSPNRSADRGHDHQYLCWHTSMPPCIQDKIGNIISFHKQNRELLNCTIRKASDLQDTLLHPLQRFMKNELKAFKARSFAYEQIVSLYAHDIYL